MGEPWQGHLYLGSVGMGTRGRVPLRGKEPVPTFQALGFPPKGPLPHSAWSRGAGIGPTTMSLEGPYYLLPDPICSGLIFSQVPRVEISQFPRCPAHLAGHFLIVPSVCLCPVIFWLREVWGEQEVTSSFLPLSLPSSFCLHMPAETQFHIHDTPKPWGHFSLASSH